MSIQNQLTYLLESKGIDSRTFCLRFGVETIADLPLIHLDAIAKELNINPISLLNSNITKKKFPSTIQLLILDVDGVMTDGGMYFSESGEQSKKFNTKDGMGILHLTRSGFQVGIISSGFKGEMVRARAEMLKIQHFYLGREKKLSILKQWCEELRIDLSQVAMIGDDVNDLEIMKNIGFSAAPSDAVPRVLAQVDCVLKNKGGEGCIREFIEEIMRVEVEF
jgi:3-deoxy-D-manno-octulosonate 8-phosphate phosphatase (KDO 8-P phosphatase)